jgi:hypothetical protein
MGGTAVGQHRPGCLPAAEPQTVGHKFEELGGRIDRVLVAEG